MNQIITITNCPICNSVDIEQVLSVKDFTVSGELFEIDQCNTCLVRFTNNIPPEKNINHYYKSENYISHSDTSKGVINKLYQLIRKETLKKKRILIEKTSGLKNGQLLDVGSGTGAFVNEMNLHGWQVTGLEPDEQARANAQKLYHLNLQNNDQFYDLQPGTFDVITLWHVLEHVYDLSIYVSQLKNLLKENGILFIAVPNYTSLDASIYKEYWAAYDVPRHLYHFSPQSMEVLLTKHDLKLIDCKPMWYDSFYISMLSSKYKNGKTNFVTAVFDGLRSNLVALSNIRKCSSIIYIIKK